MLAGIGFRNSGRSAGQRAKSRRGLFQEPVGFAAVTEKGKAQDSDEIHHSAADLVQKDSPAYPTRIGAQHAVGRAIRSGSWLATWEMLEMFQIGLGEFIVWLIVGGLAGSLAGRVVTMTKEGFGRWVNLSIGMVGAFVGGFLFNIFNIDLGLGDLKVTFEDLIAAFVGSLLCIFLWWLFRKTKAARQKQEAPN